MSDVALTTIDNPFDPFNQFEEWFAFDHSRGYDTPNYLARVALVSDELSDEIVEELTESAIDEIVDLDPFDLYIKVRRQVTTE